MDNEDFKVPIKEKKKAYEVDFTSLSQTAIEKMMDSELEHIAGIFGVDVSRPYRFVFGVDADVDVCCGRRGVVTRMHACTLASFSVFPACSLSLSIAR